MWDAWGLQLVVMWVALWDHMMVDLLVAMLVPWALPTDKSKVTRKADL